jgi:hypothetical protein
LKNPEDRLLAGVLILRLKRVYKSREKTPMQHHALSRQGRSLTGSWYLTNKGMATIKSSFCQKPKRLFIEGQKVGSKVNSFFFQIELTS